MGSVSSRTLQYLLSLITPRSPNDFDLRLGISPVPSHIVIADWPSSDWYAKEKLKKLQCGSVKGFIAENPTIKSLNAFDDARVAEVEKILQIRHLYTHQNGIVDEKFRHYFPATKVNDETKCLP